MEGETLADRTRALLSEMGIGGNFSSYKLLTTPRFFGYVFNPVSFILCFKPEGSVGALISQVNNTFGECHIYVCEKPTTSNCKRFLKFAAPKVFHVSPFNEVKGKYNFFVREDDSKVELRINLLEEIKGQIQVKFRSSIKGIPEEMSMGNWLRLWMRYPIGGSAAVPLITYQAAKLYFKRRLPVFSKPIAKNHMTVRKAEATMFEKLSESLVVKYLSSIKTGRLRLEVGDSFYVFGDKFAKTETMQVKNRDLFLSMILGGDIAFGEGYVKNHWDSPDVVGVLRVLAANLKNFENGEPFLARMLRPLSSISHFLRHNSKFNAKKNISAHYDLSNDFFASFLDESMSYSCALFGNSNDSLYSAQVNKIDTMLNKLQLESHHHLLEIGTGWGALAIRAARKYGCRVTTVTLSKEQKKEAEIRIGKLGLSDLITVEYCDYRDIEGKFDRIVSVEMLEAVGHRYYRAFFEKLDALLATDGLIALQTITIPDQRYNSYKNSCDWIQKYIFPGGLCPSISVLTDTMAKHSELIVEDIQNIGEHYARTLREWRDNFNESWETIAHDEQSNFDEKFRRTWLYYLSYCEAGFAERVLGTHHLTLTRAQNKSLGQAPGYEIPEDGSASTQEFQNKRIAS
jgi:cyclopropane-fatty-acyl-phospholipid synthase